MDPAQFLAVGRHHHPFVLILICRRPDRESHAAAPRDRWRVPRHDGLSPRPAAPYTPRLRDGTGAARARASAGCGGGGAARAHSRDAGPPRRASEGGLAEQIELRMGSTRAGASFAEREAHDPHRGQPASLRISRPAAAASCVGGGDGGHRERAAAQVGAAAQVVERARPAQPSATSTRPSRHGRPKVSVTTMPSGPAPRATSPRACGRRGVGIDGQQHGLAVLRRVREIDTRVRADEAVRGLADQHALAATHHALRLAQDHLDLARVLAVLGGDAARLGARLDRRAGRTSRPSAFDTTFWHTTTTPSRSGTPARAAAARELAARSSPGADRGMPGSAEHEGHAQRAAVPSSRSSARVRGAAASLASRARSVLERGRGRSRARAARARGTARRAHGRLAVGLRAVRAETGRDGAGRPAQQRRRAAVACGREHRARAALLAERREQAGEIRARSARTSPSTTSSAPSGSASVAPSRRARRSGPGRRERAPRRRARARPRPRRGRASPPRCAPRSPRRGAPRPRRRAWRVRAPRRPRGRALSRAATCRPRAA